MIVLTTYDADYVCNVIRAQLRDLDEAYNEAMKEGNRRTELALSLAKDFAENDSELQNAVKDFGNTRQKAINNLNAVYSDKRQKYEKIIELMMCGSC